jgi:hypothetical protein
VCVCIYVYMWVRVHVRGLPDTGTGVLDGACQDEAGVLSFVPIMAVAARVWMPRQHCCTILEQRTCIEPGVATAYSRGDGSDNVSLPASV